MLCEVTSYSISSRLSVFSSRVSVLLFSRLQEESNWSTSSRQGHHCCELEHVRYSPFPLTTLIWLSGPCAHESGSRYRGKWSMAVTSIWMLLDVLGSFVLTSGHRCWKPKADLVKNAAADVSTLWNRHQHWYTAALKKKQINNKVQKKTKYIWMTLNCDCENCQAISIFKTQEPTWMWWDWTGEVVLFAWPKRIQAKIQPTLWMQCNAGTSTGQTLRSWMQAA